MLDVSKWYKYQVVESGNQSFLPIYKDFDEHSLAMGEYQADDSYRTKEKFLSKYFKAYHFGRIERYHNFINKQNFHKGSRIFSIASGRAALEAVLTSDGFEVVASDLGIPSSFKKLSKLFTNLNYEIFDCSSEKSVKENGGYDCVLFLSVSAHLDNVQLEKSITNCREMLNGNGVVIFDTSGSSSKNPLANFLINIAPRWEAYILSWILSVKHGRKFIVQKRHHGYRRSEKSIKKMFKKGGFELISSDYSLGEVEFCRTILGGKLTQYPIYKKICQWFGKLTPYCRLYAFKPKESKPYHRTLGNDNTTKIEKARYSYD